MSSTNLNSSKTRATLISFLKSFNFSKAVLVGIAITIPLILGILSGYLEIALAISFGAFWSSPSNTSGSYRHKKLGIIFSTVLVIIVSFIGGHLNFSPWLILPVLGLLTFAISFISIYGFRASLISFSGLLALVLSFAHTPQKLETYEYALLIGLGGLWYLLLVIFWHRLNPKAQTKESLSETFALTAQFLETRGELIGTQPNRESLQEKLIKLQGELIEHHETLRDILIATRKKSGNSKYQEQQLLVFVQLVDILETAIANPVNYDKMDQIFEKHFELKQYFKDLILKISRQLEVLGSSEKRQSYLSDNESLISVFKNLRNKIEILNSTEDGAKHESVLALQNLLYYQEKQFEKLQRIQWLLNKPKLKTSDIIATDILKRFIVPQDYSPKLWISNLNFKSTIFKHSLRLAVTIMVGYALGIFFDFQNPYWILLTVIVIMRPNYGLTKARSKDRIIGTLIGAAIATGFILVVDNTYVYGVVGILSLVVGFSMVQKNYKTSATFITLTVVLIYAIIQPDILAVIQYRIFDTLIGAALSFMAILWLWPAWGFLEIQQDIWSSVSSNRDFFNHISNYYVEKGRLSTTYNVSRKAAFLETSNLNAAFQRMAQEPKSKQKGRDQIYELVVLNHTLLSSLASFSTYIKNNKTTQASKQFKMAVKTIDHNLLQVLEYLNAKQNVDHEKFTGDKIMAYKEQLSKFQFSEIINLQKEEPKEGRNYQEAHLISEQLQWLRTISENMLKQASSLRLNKA